MKKEAFNLYSIPIEINGISQKSVIDTGAKYFILSKNYKAPESKTDLEIINFLKSNELQIKTAFDAGVKVDVKFGSQKETVKALNYYNKLLKVSETGRKLSSEICLFGYPMYKDKVIQLDFNNLNLIIKE